jgi:peptide/nickel transport system substrate-binding protein
MQSLLPEEYAGRDTVVPFDLAKANQLLDAAGYKKGADGKRTNPDGSPLAINFSVQAGFIDYQAIADVVVKGLKDAGVDAKVTASAPDSVDGQKKSGDFQLMLEYLHGGCELAKNIGAKLSSTQIPTKTEILPNVQRFKDPAVDAAVAKLASDTDKESQKKDLAPLVETMTTQYPVTSLIYAPARIIYRTDKAVGWPSEDDPYANPQDDKLLVLTHLTAAK